MDADLGQTEPVAWASPTTFHPNIRIQSSLFIHGQNPRYQRLVTDRAKQKGRLKT
ncbi:MAG: hypothetical protein KIC74_01340 [Neisseria sp.]|uniref:hypothetical protein n=1 Tax=Neisseria mucosa TaxID=488 RepID=UPI001920EDA8|nr:hypothetical protein [Neisseria mucosa]MBS5835460.1 hypothetical protein [Neisseria sp.]